MSCYKSSNNIHYDENPRMSDGRLFTDYLPNDCINKNFIGKNINGKQINNHFEQRQFLTNNGLELLNPYKHGYCDCAKPFQIGTMLEHRDNLVCDRNNCKVVKGSPNGVGQGRIYTNKPNELLDSLDSVPLCESNICYNSSDMAQYCPINPGNEELRLSMWDDGFILQGGDKTKNICNV